MNIKRLPARFFAAILAVIIGSVVLHAQSAVFTNKSDTNGAAARVESSDAGTNSTSGTNAGAKAGTNSPGGPAEIENSGIQAGRSDGSRQGEINRRNNSGFGNTIIALTAIVSPFVLAFGLPVAIIFTVFYFRHRQNKMLHETVRAMVERGLPVTPELIAGLNARGSAVSGKSLSDLESEVQYKVDDLQGRYRHGKSRNRQLLPGLILAGIGLGLICSHPSHFGAGGLIIFFIGLAFLIVWLVERNQNANDERRSSGSKEGTAGAERKQDNEQQPPKV